MICFTSIDIVVCFFLFCRFALREIFMYDFLIFGDPPKSIKFPYSKLFRYTATHLGLQGYLVGRLLFGCLPWEFAASR